MSKDFKPAAGDATLTTADGSAIKVDTVEAYATMLDLPLLPVDSLNKLDALTFVTYNGMNHHKIVGYQLRSAMSDDADPELTLYTALTGTTIELTTSSANLVSGSSSTSIDVDADTSAAARRRLLAGDGADNEGSGAAFGRCLANGACLYSKDELLELRAAGRRLTGDESYFAHADIGTFELGSGDEVFDSLMLPEYRAYGEALLGEFSIRFAWTANFKGVLVVNTSTLIGTLDLPSGTYVFDLSDDEKEELTYCKPDANPDVFLASLESILPDLMFNVTSLNEGDEPPSDFMVRQRMHHDPSLTLALTLNDA